MSRLKVTIGPGRLPAAHAIKSIQQLIESPVDACIVSDEGAPPLAAAGLTMPIGIAQPVLPEMSPKVWPLLKERGPLSARRAHGKLLVHQQRRIERAFIKIAST